MHPLFVGVLFAVPLLLLGAAFAFSPRTRESAAGPVAAWSAVGVMLFAFLASVDADAQRASPQPSAAIATQETLSGITATDGWCVATNGTAALDLDAAAPARMTASLIARVRFVSIRFVGGVTSTRACHRVGGALQAAACNALDGDAAGVLTDGQTATYATARDLVNGGLPQMEAQANAGTDGAVCVVVGW